MRRLLPFIAAVLLFAPTWSHAWWNAEWTGRKKITLDTSAQGAAVQEGLATVPVLVRLHTGNFPFAEAHMDGNDLRFVAEDDKTPLKFHVDKFDGVNELALVWVQAPTLAPNSATGHVWLYYGNDKAPPAGEAKGTYDATHTLVLHFAEPDGAFKDATAYAQPVAASGVRGGGTGVADGAALFDGNGNVRVTGPALKITPAGFTASAWVKPADATRSATLFAQQDGTNAIAVLVEQGKVFARVLGVDTAKVDLPVGGWHHVALTVGDRAVLYVDGIEAGSAAAKAVEMAGEFTIGAGFAGEIDELQLANVPRSAAWIAAAVASQGEAAKLVKVSTESEAGEGGEDASYLGILLSAVTLDGWIVIGILMVMMVVSFAVMILKSVFLARMDSANKAFQKRFADIVDLLDATGETKGQQHASLARLYEIASRELRKRVGTQGTGAVVSGKAIDAIRASLDAQVVRESARLNSQMVLLTISISGGPFLGLLGTVVGVMITFAAIAAAGDVNVNSIAPGIAAALVATVAGLAVAIPALFGYNYLASRIKTISADMHVFVDEVTTRIAERYAD